MKSGYVGIVGRPNAGKSTFLNTLIGKKVSIISPIPQTTRRYVRGIYTSENIQIIFLDSPGIYQGSGDLFNQYVIKEIKKVIKESDVVLHFVDISRRWGEEEEQIYSLVKEVDKKKFLALNKIDLVEEPEKIKEDIKNHIDFNLYENVHLISALTGKNLDTLIKDISRFLPDDVQYYPEDFYTDQPVKFRIEEIIREKIFNFTSEEIPHGVVIRVNEVVEKNDGDLIYIQADIMVNKDSHKGIIIGKNGNLIKEIGTAARKELEEIFEAKIYLELKVKVLKDWREKEKYVKKIF